MYFFFFKQKTAYEMRISDWSSDVCSSDLMIQQSKGVDGQSLRPAFHPRWTSCISRKLFKVGAQGSEAVGSNIVRSGPAAIERQHIEVNQITGVNEVDQIPATAHDIDVPVFRSEESRKGKEWLSTFRS